METTGISARRLNRASTTRVGRRALSAAFVLAAAGMAALAAQPERPAPPPPRPAHAADQPLLRGPAVEETGIPGTERAFSMTQDLSGPQNRMLNREIPMNEFMGAIRALNAPETPVELNLTPEQREGFGAITREHAQAMRQHMQAHREELAGLGQTLGFDLAELQRGEQVFGQRLAEGERRARRAAAPQNGGPAGGQPNSQPGEMAPPPDAPRGQRSPEQMIRERVGENPTPEQRAALMRLKEIRDGGPSGLEAQTQAWNLLTEPQQVFVQARFDEARARQQAQRGEMYVQELIERGNLTDRPAGGPGAPAGGAATPAALRLHQIIDELSPQEQEVLLRLVENRLQQRRGQADGARRGMPDDAERRPAPPPMDRINVPPAEPI